MTYHGQQAGASVTQSKVFIRELGPVNRLAARAIAPGEVPGLQHKVRYHAVEDGVFEPELFLWGAFLA